MPATLRRRRLQFQEDAVLGGSRVDRAAGIIRGVKVLGLTSTNGRRYTPEAIKRAASLYEGVRVYVDHPTRANEQRGADSRFGQLVNVRVKPAGLFADLKYLRSHPMADRVAEAADHMPSAFGLSHNAEGDGHMEGGTHVIEAITMVHSVDLVADPATTNGLFEGRNWGGNPLLEALGEQPVGSRYFATAYDFAASFLED